MTEGNVFDKSSQHILNDEQVKLRQQLSGQYFAWGVFDLSNIFKGFILNLVDPLMNPSGYLISLRKSEDMVEAKEDPANSPNFGSNVLELLFLLDEKQIIKQIRDFVCKRHSIKPFEFVQALKNYSKSPGKQSSFVMEDSLAGEYFNSHELRNPVKNIKMFNMNTINMNSRSNTVGGQLSARISLEPDENLEEHESLGNPKKLVTGILKKGPQLDDLEPDVTCSLTSGKHHDCSRQKRAEHAG